MAELNGLCEVPDGMLHFQENGTAFALDIVEAHDKLNDIAKECDGRTDHEHLRKLQEWVSSQGGPALRLGKLDNLWNKLRVEYQEQKKRHSIALGLTPTLLNSTDLTPQAGAA